MTDVGSHRARHVLWAVLLLVLCIAIVVGTGRAATKRGDAPRCQIDCGTAHRKAVKKLIDDYNRTGDKKEFQDRFDHAVKIYSECIENCKTVVPIK